MTINGNSHRAAPLTPEEQARSDAALAAAKAADEVRKITDIIIPSAARTVAGAKPEIKLRVIATAGPTGSA